MITQNRAAKFMCLIPAFWLTLYFYFFSKELLPLIYGIVFLSVSLCVLLAPRLFVYLFILCFPSIAFFSEEIKPIHDAFSLVGVVNLAIFFGSITHISFFFEHYNKNNIDKLKIFLLFLLLVMISILVATSDLILTATYFIWLGNLFLLALIIRKNFTHPKQLRILLYVVLFSSAFFSLFALHDYFIQSIYADTGDGGKRIASIFFKNSNELSLYSILTFGIGFTIFKVSNDIIEIFLSILLISIVGSVIFLTFSLSGWLSVIAFFVARRFLRARLKELVLGVAFLTVVLGVALVLDLATFLPARIAAGATGGVRLVLIWPAVLELIFANPWLGYSPGESAGPLSDIAGEHVVSAHNIFLGLLLNYGVLGLAVLLWFFYTLTQQLRGLYDVKHATPVVRELALTLAALSFAVVVYGAGHNVDLSMRHTIVLWLVGWATLAFLPTDRSRILKVKK